MAAFVNGFSPSIYTLANGGTRTNYKVLNGIILIEEGYVNYTELRAIQRVKNIGRTVENAREVCSHLSCESSTEIMDNKKVKNITDSVTPDIKGKCDRHKPLYVENLF